MITTGKHKCPETEEPVIIQGKWADRYSLGEAIGEGTFSIVYKAKTENGDTVAIKRLKRHLQDHTRLRDEVLALVTIGDHQCDHVVQAFDAAVKDDRLSIVMEYFQHDDFAGAIQRGAFTPEHIREYMRGLLIGLRHIHARGYIHRDIKPTNVLYNFERKHVRSMLAALLFLLQPLRAPYVRAPSHGHARKSALHPPPAPRPTPRRWQAMVVDFGLAQLDSAREAVSGARSARSASSSLAGGRHEPSVAFPADGKPESQCKDSARTAGNASAGD